MVVTREAFHGGRIEWYPAKMSEIYDGRARKLPVYRVGRMLIRDRVTRVRLLLLAQVERERESKSGPVRYYDISSSYPSAMFRTRPITGRGWTR